MTEAEFIANVDVEALSPEELEGWYEAYVGIVKDRQTLDMMLTVGFPIQDYINKQTDIPAKIRRAFIRGMEWKRGTLRPQGQG